MAGSIIGGQKARDTNIKRHGADYYVKLGALGGKRGTTGGFATRITCTCDLIPQDHYIVNCAGKKGGSKSKRGSKK